MVRILKSRLSEPELRIVLDAFVDVIGEVMPVEVVVPPWRLCKLGNWRVYRRKKLVGVIADFEEYVKWKKKKSLKG